MARAGRAYPTHPIIIHGLLTTGATPPSTPRPNRTTVVLAAEQTAARKQIRFEILVGKGKIVPVVVVFPTKPYVVKARSARSRPQTEPPTWIRRAQLDIIRWRQPVVVLTTKQTPRRGKFLYKPWLPQALRRFVPFIKPPPAVVVEPLREPRRPLPDLIAKVVRLVIVSPPGIVTAPVIAGPVWVGNDIHLTTAGTYTGSPTLTYQWQRDNTGGGVWSDIASQTGLHYITADVDIGCNIRVVETATNGAGSVTQNSNVIGPILDIVAPYPSFFLDLGDGEPWDPDLPLTPMQDKLNRRRRNA